MRFWQRFSRPQHPAYKISGGQLRRLLEEDSEQAWRVFLTDYTGLMFAAIQSGYRHVGTQADDDLIAETYADVLNKLSAASYRNLKSYQEKSQLNTWLTSVCRNACIDRLRKDAPPEAPVSIQRLDEVHQAFFKLRYVERREERECQGFLGNMGFLLSESEFDKVVAEVENNLTEGSTVRFTAHRRDDDPISIDGSPTDEKEGKSPPVVSDESTAVDAVIEEDEKVALAHIRNAIQICKSALSDQEQMIINLIYRKRKKPKDIAGLMNLPANEVSRKKGNALKKLKQCALGRLQRQGYTEPEIEEIAYRLERLYPIVEDGT